MNAVSERTLDGTEARTESYLLVGFVAFLILAAVLAVVAVQSYYIKRDAARSLYENLTFTRIAVEARQHIRKVEFGIKNGRELEQFYNMNSILRDIQRGSSYIAGVYIVGSMDVLLYSLDMTDGDTTPLRRPINLTFEGEKVYQMMDNSFYFDLFLPIYDEGGRDVAFIIVRLDRDVVFFSTRSLVEQEYMQSVVIGLLMLGIGLIAILKIKPKTGGIIILVFLFCFVCLSLDFVLAYSRYRGIAESATVQSVNRIAQMLQSDIDVIRAMGVPPDAIHDQNSWLRQAIQGLPMILYGSMDSNMRISLTASRAYINQFSTGLLRSYATFYAGLILAAAISVMVLRIRERVLRKKMAVQNTVQINYEI